MAVLLPRLSSINPDGTANVNIVQSNAFPDLTVDHNEVTLVASGVETIVITVNAPITPLRVQRIEVSGENIALFRVKINGTIISNKRTFWGSLNEAFEYVNTYSSGVLLDIGDSLTVTALHTRPTLAKFEATVLTR